MQAGTSQRSLGLFQSMMTFFITCISSRGDNAHKYCVHLDKHPSYKGPIDWEKKVTQRNALHCYRETKHQIVIGIQTSNHDLHGLRWVFFFSDEQKVAIVNPNVTGQKQEKSNPLQHALFRVCIIFNVRGWKVHPATFFLKRVVEWILRLWCVKMSVYAIFGHRGTTCHKVNIAEI